VIYSLKKNAFEIICILPLVLFLVVFTFSPIVRIIGISFQNDAGEATLANYAALLAQAEFRQAFGHTVFIALVSLAIEITIGMIMALILSHRLPAANIMRTFFLIPLAIPTVVVGVMMGYIFSTSGWLNRLLMDLALIPNPIHWMQGGLKSLMMVTLADCWKVTPLVMLILLAGIKSIDTQLFDAAVVDGASGFQIFRRITLPLIMPFVTAAVIIRGIDAFRIFALPLILMGQNLKVIGTYAYLEYMDYQNIYLSAASAVILLVMILGAVAMYIRVTGRQGIEVS